VIPMSLSTSGLNHVCQSWSLLSYVGSICGYAVRLNSWTGTGLPAYLSKCDRLLCSDLEVLELVMDASHICGLLKV